ncbi:MAG: lipopolysaccharide assembly protein LapA domain-containing protein [Candidatus Bipolaricaulia bacterium]
MSQATEPQRPRPGPRNVRLISALVLAALIVIFALQNTEATTVELFAWSITTSRALMLFVVLVVGIALGWLLRSLQQRRRRSARS